MNLRSGVIARQNKSTTKKKRGKERKSKERGEMATSADKNFEESVKQMITALREDISKQFGELKQNVEKLSKDTRDLHKDIKEIRNDMLEMSKKHEEENERINGLEERETLSQAILSYMISEQRDMREKIDYLENKSRQNNIRIYQVKEGAEGDDMVGFVTRLIAEKLGIPATSEMVIVAAHRSLVKRPNGEAPPRSIVVRFLQWDTRQKVLKAAWAQRDIRYGETRIYFDRDYSAKVQQERARYGPIRRRLREKSIKSHIIYPAKMKVFIDDDIIIFDTPEEATEQLVTRGILQEPPPPADPRPWSSKSSPFARVGTQVNEKAINELITELKRKTSSRAETV